MKPELFLSWANEQAGFIDNLKLKKEVKIFPIKFTATGTWNLHSKQFSHKFSCKDVIVHGKISFNPTERALEYRKRFALPMIGSRFGCLVASGRWAFNDESQVWTPSFRVGFEFKSGGAEMVQLNAIRFKPKLFYKNVGIEARTQLTFQLPSKLLFEVPSGSDLNRMGSGRAVEGDDDALGINLDVQQLNLVVRM